MDIHYRIRLKHRDSYVSREIPDTGNNINVETPNTNYDALLQLRCITCRIAIGQSIAEEFERGDRENLNISRARAVALVLTGSRTFGY